jgi:hypothetical protein
MKVTKPSMKNKSSTPPARRRKPALFAARAYIQRCTRLECLDRMEKSYLADFAKIEQKLWRTPCGIIPARHPGGQKQFKKDWKYLIELEAALRVVARMRQRLSARRVPEEIELPRLRKP